MECKITSIKKLRRSSGSILVLTVVVTAMVGFLMASYLQLVKSQNMANMRSQAWNAVVPVIEAGIEDALTHLNVNNTSTLIKDGWQKTGDVFWIKRNLDATTYYFVTISNFVNQTSMNPVVESRGYVKMPVQVVSSSQVMFASSSASASSQGFLARGVRVTAGKDALFSKGLVAKGRIDMNGNNIATDSFDSADSSASTGGLYDVTKRKDNGDVATNSGLVNSINAGNANILGKISTGPGGSIAVGFNGVVGNNAWHTGGSTGIQPGASSDDMNVDFPNINAPFSGGALTPIPGVSGGVAYTYVLPSGNYQLATVNMFGTAKMLVTGDAVLYVPGNFSISGSAQIEIAPGARLKLYVAGPTTSLGGNGIINKSSTADNFYYYGLPSNTSLSMTGNGTFMGVIYAPQADLTLNGGGSGSEDFMGASVTKTVTMNGHFKFHYDENLARLGPNRGYSVRTWNEMYPTEVQAFSFARAIELDLEALNQSNPDP